MRSTFGAPGTTPERTQAHERCRRALDEPKRTLRRNEFHRGIRTVRITDSGQFSVAATLDALLPLVTDPDFMARALPDVREYHVDGPDRASLKIAVGVSHVRGVLPSRFRLERAPGGHALTVIGDASGMGSRIDFKLALALTERDGAVDVDWQSTADVVGLLASVGAGLLRPLARTKFDQVVASVQAALASATAS
jgi:carbon monoxide dehydrogenase subunit G